MPGITLIDLCAALADNVGDFSTLSLSQLCTFLAVTSSLRNDILLCQPSKHPVVQTPPFLPPKIIAFLSDCCEVSPITIQECWAVLGDLVWQKMPGSGVAMSDEALEAVFVRHGVKYGFSMFYSFILILLNTF